MRSLHIHNIPTLLPLSLIQAAIAFPAKQIYLANQIRNIQLYFVVDTVAYCYMMMSVFVWD